MKVHIICVALFISAAASAQTDSATKRQTIHGVVNDEKSRPVNNAFVSIEGEDVQTTTDSLGFFRIEAYPNAVLYVVASGYEPVSEQVQLRNLLHITLTHSASSPGSIHPNDITNQQIISDALQDYAQTAGTLYTGALLPVVHHTDETRGSRYLCTKWVHGTVTTTQDKLLKDDSVLFNYDKISGTLLMTRDKRLAMAITRKNIKSFDLNDGDQDFNFERFPPISDRDFLQVLVKSEKFMLFKLIVTRLEKANYTTDGLTESGHNYDEYIDAASYFVVFPGDTFRKIELTRRSIKDILSQQAREVKKYFAEHRSDFINEGFLIGLIDSLNH